MMTGRIQMLSSKCCFSLFVLALLVGLTGYTHVAEAVYSIPADRVATWKGNVGVSQRSGIPARTTICATIDAATYGNGTTNAATVINDAINACPNGQTVYLPAGKYRINSFIIIPKGKSITLRGAGRGVTTIMSYSTNQDLNGAAIQIGDSPTSFGQFVNPNYCPQVNAPAGYVQDITGGGTLGSTSIIVANASSISVGDLGLINVLNNNNSNQDFWTQATDIGQEDGDSIFGHCCSSATTCRSLGQVVEVTGKNGNTLTVNPPLYTNYTAHSSIQFSTIKSADLVKNVGIEDMTVSNAQGTNGVNTLIGARASYQVWIKNVETSNAKGRHVWFRHLGLFNELRDSYLHDSLTFSSNNYGIDMEQWVSGTLVENNMFNNTMTAVILGGGSSGNVVAYNYMHILKYTVNNSWLQSFVAQHASHSWMNLLEGNWGTEVLLDQIHGTNSHFTAFRNYLRYDSPPNDGYTKTQNVAIYVEKGSRLHNFIGNVLGYPGFPYRYESNGGACSNSGSAIYTFGYAYGSYCNSATWDSKSSSTTIRHANYDYVTKSVVWNGSDDRTLPVSYYLTSKPSWWGNLMWPPIGPDVPGYVTSIPAKDRFFSVQPAKTPSAPYPH